MFRLLLNAQLKDSSGSKKTIPSSGSSTGKKSIEQALAEKLAKSGKTASATAKTTTKTTREAYYSPPEFGREEELQGLASAVENAGKKYQIGRSLAESTAERVVQLQQELESKRVHTSTRAGRAVYAGIEREYQHYAKLNGMAVTKAQECFDAYQRAVDSYNGYAQKQQAEYERWKSTIRDEDTIRAELDEVARRAESLYVTTTTALWSDLEKRKGHC